MTTISTSPSNSTTPTTLKGSVTPESGVRSNQTTVSTTEIQRPPHFFSVFRTHINLPFSHFNHKKSSPKDHDIEASPYRFPASSESQGVETNIWSGPTASGALRVEDEPIDPLSPKLGSRAYRERERREAAADREHTRALSANTIPDEVVIISKTLNQTTSDSS